MMEVCGLVYQDSFICGMTEDFGDHDPDVRVLGGHEYQPVLMVPLPLNYEAGYGVIEEWLKAEPSDPMYGEPRYSNFRRAVGVVLGVDDDH